MEGHAAKNNESTFPSFVDLDDFLNKHNSNFVWLLVGEFQFCLFFFFTSSSFCTSVDFVPRTFFSRKTYSDPSAVSGSSGRRAFASLWSIRFRESFAGLRTMRFTTVSPKLFSGVRKYEILLLVVFLA